MRLSEAENKEMFLRTNAELVNSFRNEYKNKSDKDKKIFVSARVREYLPELAGKVETCNQLNALMQKWVETCDITYVNQILEMLDASVSKFVSIFNYSDRAFPKYEAAIEARWNAATKGGKVCKY